MGNKKNALNKQSSQTSTKTQIENRDYNSFKTVLKYCLFIILFPVFTFFASKFFLFDEYLKLDVIRSNIWSAVLAVIALHIALGLYIYRAYFEVEYRDIPTAAKKQE